MGPDSEQQRSRGTYSGSLCVSSVLAGVAAVGCHYKEIPSLHGPTMWKFSSCSHTVGCGLCSSPVYGASGIEAAPTCWPALCGFRMACLPCKWAKGKACCSVSPPQPEHDACGGSVCMLAPAAWPASLQEGLGTVEKHRDVGGPWNSL